jgi:septum site-determining protein MinC
MTSENFQPIESQIPELPSSKIDLSFLDKNAEDSIDDIDRANSKDSLDRPFLDNKLLAAIKLKADGEKMLLILPPESECKLRNEWGQLEQELKHRLQGDRNKWEGETPIHAIVQDQLLDGRHLQSLERILKDVKLKLQCVQTHRRQTAVAAATAGYSVEQRSLLDAKVNNLKTSKPLLAEPLYLETTIRSGVEVRHSGNVVIVGDLNPRGAVIAAGDVIIWGRLRGTVHAGAQGDRSRRIMALRIEQSQLRIADVISRVSEKPHNRTEAEVAFITIDGIRIESAIDFTKNNTFSELAGSWQRSDRQSI